MGGRNRAGPLIAHRAGRWRAFLPSSPLALAPLLTVAVFAVPILGGFAATVLPAFGYLPALGGETLTLAPWIALAREPALSGAAILSLTSGFGATALSLAVVVAFCAAWHGSPWFVRFTRVLSPLLSVPHVAVAFGLVFLLSPSGWIVRLLSPWATGYDRPPDWALAPDPYGVSLVLGLAIKEIPFLFLMTLSALGQIKATELARVATTLGYGPATGWLKAVFPAVYKQIRLPVYAVLAYSMSVVDVAAILAPTTPAPLAPLLLRWFNDPELTLRLQASAGAVLQTGLVLAALLAWIVAERICAWVGLRWIMHGIRGAGDVRRRVWRVASAGAMTASALAAALGLAGMAVWSFAARWRFPDAMPSTFTLSAWMRAVDTMGATIWNTVWIAAAASSAAVILALACLEYERLFGLRERAKRALWVLYLPLLVPQIGFLFGVQVILVRLGLDGGGWSVAAVHLLFVLPYVFLSLSDPYRALDPRYARTAASLGSGPGRVFVSVVLPLLMRPVLVAFAVGFAVSVAQYLPTVFAGAGRVSTVTLEAVSLAAGGDRRVIGVHVLLQTALPLIAFVLALAIPTLAFRNRRGLRIDR